MNQSDNVVVCHHEFVTVTRLELSQSYLLSLWEIATVAAADIELFYNTILSRQIYIYLGRTTLFTQVNQSACNSQQYTSRHHCE